METTNTFNLNSSHPGTDELQTLREEVEQLNSDLVEATEQRAQAAEYGLVLLEEKQTLQMKYEELTMLYEGTKRELDSSVNVCSGYGWMHRGVAGCMGVWLDACGCGWMHVDMTGLWVWL